MESWNDPKGLLDARFVLHGFMDGRYDSAVGYPAIDQAIDNWLDSRWRYENPSPHLAHLVPEDWEPAEAMLQDFALIVDRETERVVRTIAFRWPDLGESRLPVAYIVDVATGSVVRTVSAEQVAA